METKEIQIIPIKPRDGLVAFSSIIFESSLYLGSIGVHTHLNGGEYRITIPKIGERDMNIYHLINKETNKAIEKAIIAETKKILK